MVVLSFCFAMNSFILQLYAVSWHNAKSYSMTHNVRNSKKVNILILSTKNTSCIVYAKT